MAMIQVTRVAERIVPYINLFRNANFVFGILEKAD